MTWTTTDYPFNGVVGSAGFQRQTATIFTDGRENAIVFPVPFISPPATVSGAIVNSGSGQYALGTPQFDSVTTTGFNVYVPGGAPSSTATLEWWAIR